MKKKLFKCLIIFAFCIIAFHFIRLLVLAIDSIFEINNVHPEYEEYFKVALIQNSINAIFDFIVILICAFAIFFSVKTNLIYFIKYHYEEFKEKYKEYKEARQKKKAEKEARKKAEKKADLEKQLQEIEKEL